MLEERLRCYQPEENKCYIVDFIMPSDHRAKEKKGEKYVKYLDSAPALKNHNSRNPISGSWNSLQSPGKTGDEVGISLRIETFQTTTLRKSVGTSRIVQET